MTGGDVKFVQKALNKRNYGLTEDGVYGPKTRAAVLSFQGKNGLYKDGEVGPNTWNKL
jgi:peptidoglycan hydrolase-like protein with peptidoglycan-binding domain